MKKIYAFCFASLLTITAFNSMGQAPSLEDISGRVIKLTPYTDVEGSPFLYDDWMSGTVKMSNAQVYANVYLKYDEVSGTLYFKGKADEVLKFVDPVAEFTINDNLTTKRFVNYAGNTHLFYELLADGATKLLKQQVKNIQETKAYTSATVSKIFFSVDKYYVLKGDKLMPVKKDKKSLLATLGDKQTELEAYIKTNSINLKNDSDLARLIIYYNSL